MSGTSGLLLRAYEPHLASVLLLGVRGSWDHILWCIA